MNEELTLFFVEQGPWAVVFVGLLIYVMRTNSIRENRLHEILDKFSDKYDLIVDELRDLKGRLR